MTRPTARSLAFAACTALVLAPWCAAAPLAAQGQPGSFTLPDPTPTPSPAPAGPADERAGVAIPPRAVPSAVPVTPPPPIAVPNPRPADRPAALAEPNREGPPAARASAPTAPRTNVAPELAPTGVLEAEPATPGDPLVPPPPTVSTPVPLPPSNTGEAAAEPPASGVPAAWPAWWPYAAGGLGALALLGAAALAWRRRKPRALRLTAPADGAAEAAPSPAATPPRLDMTLEIIRATRSVMMFTLEYRITIANRSDRAVCDLALAAQIACARAGIGAGGNAASPGAAQALDMIARIGPHQARSVTGEVRMPLSAVAPLRQGNRPLFVPLFHVTLDGNGEAGGGAVTTRSFVIGTPSPSGRIHPIPLDQPPGAIAGLVAQQVAVPPASAAA